jgi:hypothetical protein
MCGTAATVSSVSIKGKRWVPSSVVDPDPYVLGHPDLDPSLFCTDPVLGPDLVLGPDPDPSINKQ